MKKIFSILFIGVVVVSLMMIPAALVGATGLVGEWHLDEGSGTTAYDSSGNGNDGTLEGGFGNALSFDGIDDYVDGGNVIQLDGLSVFTVEFWIKVDSLPFPAEWQGIIARGSSAERSPWIFGNRGSSSLYIQFETTTGGAADGSLITNDLTAGQWHHVAFTWDGATVTSYLDGSAGPADTTSGSVLVNADESLKFGYIPGYAHFDGIIDEVRLSNVVRTSFNLGSPHTVDANTVALWHFDKGTGQVAADSAGSNDGQLGSTSGVDTNDPAWVVSEIPAAGPTWTSGMFDGALSFDGVDDYVDYGDISTQNWSGLTTEAWIYWDGVTSHGYAGVYHKRYHNDIGRLLINSGGKVLVQNGNGNFFSDNNGDVPTNQWSHIAYVYDQSAGKEYIYVNGAKKGEQPRSGDIIQNSADFWIGYGWHGSTYYVFSGLIDEVRVRGYALSGDEIEYNYSLGDVGIDIKPGSDPNSINPNSKGVVPVAILGSETFDAATVDPSTVKLAGASVRLKGKSGNIGSLEDVNDDGYLDLVVQVYTNQLALQPGDTEAELTGETYSGLPFRGSDSVRIVPPK